VIWSILLVILVYDLRHQIIPDGFVYAFIALGFIKPFIFCEPTLCLSQSFIPTIISGGILFLFFFTLWFVSQGRWIGFGDAKLALGIGFYLGLGMGLSALAFAFWIGAAIGVSILMAQKVRTKYLSQGLSLGSETLTMKSAIPFAPFLIIGTFLAEMVFDERNIRGDSGVFVILRVENPERILLDTALAFGTELRTDFVELNNQQNLVCRPAGGASH